MTPFKPVGDELLPGLYFFGLEFLSKLSSSFLIGIPCASIEMLSHGRHTTIHLTERGWQVVESNVATMNQIEDDWQRQLGKRRFADLKAALQELSGIRGAIKPNK